MKKPIQKLTLAAIFIALDVVLNIFSFYWLTEKITLQPLAAVFCGWMLGPLYAGVAMGCGDILGMLVASRGWAFHPGYTLSAVLRGVLYGLLLHKRPVTLARSTAVIASVSAFIDFFLGSVWLYELTGRAFFPLMVSKIPGKVALIVVMVTLFYLLAKRLSKSEQVQLFIPPKSETFPALQVGTSMVIIAVLAVAVHAYFLVKHPILKTSFIVSCCLAGVVMLTGIIMMLFRRKKPSAITNNP